MRDLLAIVHAFLVRYRDSSLSRAELMAQLPQEVSSSFKTWRDVYGGIFGDFNRCHHSRKTIGMLKELISAFEAANHIEKSETHTASSLGDSKDELEAPDTAAATNASTPDKPCQPMVPEHLLRAYSFIRLVALLEQAAMAQEYLTVAVMRFAEHPKTKIMHSKLKSAFRCVEKVFFDRSDFTACLDIARAGVICDDLETLKWCLEQFVSAHKAGKMCIERIKNRFETPTEAGWRDILLNVTLPEVDHICEVQLILKIMFNARKDCGGHDGYARFRCTCELIANALLEDERPVVSWCLQFNAAARDCQTKRLTSLEETHLEETDEETDF